MTADGRGTCDHCRTLWLSHNQVVKYGLECASYSIRNRHVKKATRPGHYVALAEYYQNFVVNLLTIVWLSLVSRPPALGWLVDLIEKSTVIIGTQGFQFRTALPGVNQQSLLTFSIGLPIRFTSRGGFHKRKESEKEIIVSIPPDAVTKVCFVMF